MLRNHAAIEKTSAQFRSNVVPGNNYESLVGFLEEMAEDTPYNEHFSSKGFVSWFLELML